MHDDAVLAVAGELEEVAAIAYLVGEDLSVVDVDRRKRRGGRGLRMARCRGDQNRRENDDQAMNTKRRHDAAIGERHSCDMAPLHRSEARVASVP